MITYTLLNKYQGEMKYICLIKLSRKRHTHTYTHTQYACRYQLHKHTKGTSGVYWNHIWNTHECMHTHTHKHMCTLSLVKERMKQEGSCKADFNKNLDLYIVMYVIKILNCVSTGNLQVGLTIEEKFPTLFLFLCCSIYLCRRIFLTV